MTVVDYGPDVAALRRRLEAAEAEVSRLRAVVEAARDEVAGWYAAVCDEPDCTTCRLHRAVAALDAEEAEVPRG